MRGGIGQILVGIVVGLGAIACGDAEDIEALEEVAQAAADRLALPDARPGDVVELVDGITAVVPSPGESVVIEVLYAGGDGYLLDLRTADDGGVVMHVPDVGLTADPSPSAACPTKCAHQNFNLLGHKWQKKLRWWYRDANRPSSTGKQAAIDALRYGASTITKSRNACDMADQVSATHEYRGVTSTAPNVATSGASVGCGTGDGKNVMGWSGNMPASVLAVTCVWSSGGEAVEADQKYNGDDTSWFAGNTKPDGCANRFSLRAVAAHEFGHVFGLDHTGCKQTMAPAIGPCESHRRKLGRSDVRGLRALY